MSSKKKPKTPQKKPQEKKKETDEERLHILLKEWVLNCKRKPKDKLLFPLSSQKEKEILKEINFLRGRLKLSLAQIRMSFVMVFRDAHLQGLSSLEEEEQEEERFGLFLFFLEGGKVLSMIKKNEERKEKKKK